MTRLILTSILLAFAFPIAVAAQEIEADSIPAVAPRYIVRCERKQIPASMLDDTLTITLESIGGSVAGFDLKFGTDIHTMVIIDVLPGPALDSCNWEYFHVSQKHAKGKNGNQFSVWQAVALSTVIPDSTNPRLSLPEGRVPILRVVVSSRYLSRVLLDESAPLFFVWEDCSDNALSDNIGSSLLVSSRVYDFYKVEWSDSEELFPTLTGAPPQCLKLNAVNVPKRVVEFHNGGVRYGAYFEYGQDTLDSIGRDSL